jgi:hypothetical protein
MELPSSRVVSLLLDLSLPFFIEQNIKSRAMTDLDFGVLICAMLLHSPLVSTLLAGRKWARKYLVGTND